METIKSGLAVIMGSSVSVVSYDAHITYMHNYKMQKIKR